MGNRMNPGCNCCGSVGCIIESLVPRSEYDSSNQIIKTGTDKVYYEPGLTSAEIADYASEGILDRYISRSYMLITTIEPTDTAGPGPMNLVGLKIEDEYSSIEVIDMETTPSVRYRCETRIKHNDVPRIAWHESDEISFSLLRYGTPDRSTPQNRYDTFACGASIESDAIGYGAFEVSDNPSSFAVHVAAEIDLPDTPPEITITLPPSEESWIVHTTRSRCVPLPKHPYPYTISRYRADSLFGTINVPVRVDSNESHFEFPSSVDFRLHTTTVDETDANGTYYAPSVTVFNGLVDVDSNTISPDEIYWHHLGLQHVLPPASYTDTRIEECEVTGPPPPYKSGYDCSYTRLETNDTALTPFPKTLSYTFHSNDYEFDETRTFGEGDISIVDSNSIDLTTITKVLGVLPMLTRDTRRAPILTKSISLEHDSIDDTVSVSTGYKRIKVSSFSGLSTWQVTVTFDELPSFLVP